MVGVQLFFWGEGGGAGEVIKNYAHLEQQYIFLSCHYLLSLERSFSFLFFVSNDRGGDFPLLEVWKSDQTLNFISKGKLSVILLHSQNLHFCFIKYQ